MIITFTYSKQGNIRGELTIGRGADGMGGWRLAFSFFLYIRKQNEIQIAAAAGREIWCLRLV